MQWYTQSIKQLTNDVPVYELYELCVNLSVCALGPWASTTCLFACLLDGSFCKKTPGDRRDGWARRLVRRRGRLVLRGMKGR
jgi:hypothetical protein